MSKPSVGSKLVASAGVISVLGALVIFFSWAVTNTLGQRYNSMKQSVETAESTFRLYTTLYQLRTSLISAESEAAYAREAAERIMTDDSPPDGGMREFVALTRRFNHTRSAAHQITELMAYAGETLSFSERVGNTTATSQRISAVHDSIYDLYREVLNRERATETASSPLRLTPELRSTVEEYDRFVFEEAIPRVPGLFSSIVDASNTRHDEGRAQLARSKRNAEWASRAALVLYVVGSLLALWGQYLDKVHGNKVEAKLAQSDGP